MGLEPVRLGKKMELQYIPFSELIIPWDVCVESDAEREDPAAGVIPQAGPLSYAMTPDSLRTLKNMKQDNLDDLKKSMGQFGLLKPFEVAELPEQLDFFFGRGKYLILDGQRRYFAIRELLRLPSALDERRRQESIRTRPESDQIEKVEAQAQKQLGKLSIRDYVLVPCLVYPYTTYLQMVRHSTESHGVNEKPAKIFLEIVDTMRQQGIADLSPEDLSNLWGIQTTITEEQQAIEKTLQEIRARQRA